MTDGKGILYEATTHKFLIMYMLRILYFISVQDVNCSRPTVEPNTLIRPSQDWAIVETQNKLDSQRIE